MRPIVLLRLLPAIALGLAQAETVEGTPQEHRSGPLLNLHAGRGRREGFRFVEVGGRHDAGLRVNSDAELRVVDAEAGVAMIDGGFARHASEEQPGTLIFEHVLGKIDKGRMDVVGRNNGRDAVDIAQCQMRGSPAGVYAVALEG